MHLLEEAQPARQLPGELLGSLLHGGPGLGILWTARESESAGRAPSYHPLYSAVIVDSMGNLDGLASECAPFLEIPLAMTPSHSHQRWVGHADLDAFYASVEERDHPEYRGRPVVVGALPGHRGVAATCNYAAWALFLHGKLPRKPVRLIGVGISDWQQAETEPTQADLFDQPQERERDKHLLETLDRVTDRFGKGMLQLGCASKADKLKSQ